MLLPCGAGLDQRQRRGKSTADSSKMAHPARQATIQPRRRAHDGSLLRCIIPGDVCKSLSCYSQKAIRCANVSLAVAQTFLSAGSRDIPVPRYEDLGDRNVANTRRQECLRYAAKHARAMLARALSRALSSRHSPAPFHPRTTVSVLEKELPGLRIISRQLF